MESYPLLSLSWETWFVQLAMIVIFAVTFMYIYTLSFLKTWPVQIFLLAMAVTFTYIHTLDVPFYLDDFSSIQENPIIYRWQGTLTELWQFSALRIIGYLSFALNYQIHQFQVTGYHLINILVHFLTGCAVLGLFRGLVRTPLLTTQLSPEAKFWLPLLTALIFVLHPLQTQAVTYIVQRLASLAALFYIGALASFIQARLASSGISRSFWISTSILLALLAFFTKQNTATLPLALLLLEFLFFPLPKQRLMMIGASLLLGLMILWSILIWKFQINLLTLLPELTQETEEIPRLSYLATQMHVLWTYFQLFFWPTGLHIDYDYPLTEGFWSSHHTFMLNIFSNQTLWASLGHGVLLSLALLNSRRHPLLSFGLLFYYLAHLIESGLIPIRDVIFEHRTYLPNLGLSGFCASILVLYLPRGLAHLKINIRSRITGFITLILLEILGITTWQRNQLWRDPIALWQDNVRLAPNKERGWIILGKHFIQAGRPAEGLEVLNHVVTSNTQGVVTTETALNIVVAHKMLHQYEQALEWINRFLKISTLRPFDIAKFLVNKGNIFYEQRRYQEAEASYREAIQTYPSGLKARINLANVLGITGRIDDAIALYQEVLTIEPSNAVAQQNLQTLLEAVKNSKNK